MKGLKHLNTNGENEHYQEKKLIEENSTNYRRKRKSRGIYYFSGASNKGNLNEMNR